MIRGKRVVPSTVEVNPRDFGVQVSRQDGTDFIAKNWKANSANAWEACNHVVHVSGWSYTS